MKLIAAVAALVVCSISSLWGELKSGPPLPHKVVAGWAKLPPGWNLGESSGVAVDKHDNVWVFNRGPHPVIQFDKNGKMLQSWGENTFNSSHGIRVDADGNIWAIDVKGHVVMKFDPAGRLQMILGR